MKMERKERALFDAVSGIDQALIDEAAAAPGRSGSVILRRVVAAAAALAILVGCWLFWPVDEECYVTAPGLLIVRAYAVDEYGNATVESVQLEEGVTFTPEVEYEFNKNYVQHFPFSFHLDQKDYQDMEITLEVSTNAGIFYKNEPFNPEHLKLSPAEQVLENNYGQHFRVSADKNLYWRPLGFDYDHLKQQVESGNPKALDVMRAYLVEENPSFIDVIIRGNDLIIGYCVIEIREINGLTGYSAAKFSFELIKMVSFPQVEGRWQNVSEEYVQEEIEKTHLEREALL